MADLDHTHAWRPIYGEVGRYACTCGATQHRQLDGSLRAAPAATADPDDLLTARPTDDQTIDAFGRRLAMIPHDARSWPDIAGPER